MNFINLKLQKYLQDKDIRISTARVIFKSRTRMTVYWSNFKSSKSSRNCPLCKENIIDSQEHSFECKVVKENIDVSSSTNFSDIYGDKIDPKLAKTIEEIEEFRKYKMNSE